MRGIGEGHVSSLTFRTGVWEADGTVCVNPPSAYAIAPVIDRDDSTEAGRIVHLNCGDSREISETVIFPFLPAQGKGVGDVRLTEFVEDDGTRNWRGTFTGFNGDVTRQILLKTPDFKQFEMRTIKGPLANSKGAALFPRTVRGRYLMLARQDSENIWLSSSDDLIHWDHGVKILGPRWSWEFIQMRNCGSPIELDEGWLVLTHGVGSVRNYCVGACLLDKEDPSRVLARMCTPLLEPSEMERDGYVPNVVYSCGGLLRDRTLLLPYGVADDFTTFATTEIDDLLATMS